jgi:hypothetical protein
MARAVRLRAVGAGLLPPHIAVIECRRGPDVSGLFSEAAAVVGFLDHFTRAGGLYAGVRVRFLDGLYLEPRVGPDWWNYYFEPVEVTTRDHASEQVVDPHFHDWCAYQVERSLPRTAAAALVAQYILPRQALRDAADAFIRERWEGAWVVGIHYRGTDKFEDAPRVPYEVIAAIAAEKLNRDAGSRVFVATDEAPFIDYMVAKFGAARVSFRRMFRSADGRPIDVVNGDGNHRKGFDAVLDCLLLSRASELVRTASNLSLFATFFNPALPTVLLNPER